MKVSVIVPVYNTEKYLEKCINSLVKQTLDRYEIILVNDGSTDGSEEIIEKFLKENRTLIKSFHQKNSGVSVARNKGVKEAEGEYIAFVDSDDYVTEDYLEAMYEEAKIHNSDVVISGFLMVSEKGEALSELKPTGYESGVHEEWALKIISAGGRLFKKEFLKKHQISFPAGVRGEDAPVNLIANSLGKNIRVLQNTNYRYVQHSGSAMHNFKGLKNFHLPYESLEDAIKYVKETGIVNGEAFFELTVMRMLAVFVFDFARGSEKEEIEKLCAYVKHILKTYIPGYYKNPYRNPFCKLEISFFHKLAVFVLSTLCRLHILTPVVKIYAGIFR